MQRQNERLINLASLEILVRGDRLPEGLSEEVFLVAYKYGLEGTRMMPLMFQLKDDVDSFELFDWKMLTLGYSMGQKAHADVMEATTSIALDKPSVTQ
jgi:hypothetical protein